MKKTSSYDVYSFILNGISRTHKVLAASMILTGALMCGCSDNEIVENNELTPEPQVAKRKGVVTVGSNPHDPELMKRITFFGNNGARSASNVKFIEFNDPEPSIPSGIASYEAPSDQIKDKNYVLTGGGHSGSQLLLNGGGNVYIKGDVTTTTVKGSGTVYVLSGSKLTLKSGNIESGKISIKAFGTLEAIGAKLTLASQAEILVKQNFNVSVNGGQFEANGTCVVGGTLTVDGTLKVGHPSMINAYCIEVLGDVPQSLNVEGKLGVHSYLNTCELYLNNSGTVYFWPNALAEITKKTEFSGNNGLDYMGQENDDRIAILKTQKIRAGGPDRTDAIKKLFEGNLKVNYVEQENLNGLDNYQGEIPVKDCTPGDQKPDDRKPDDQKPDDQKPDDQKPDDQKPDDKPGVTPIVIIDAPTHDHTHLSATCIQAVGDRAYVSWHLNTEYKDNASWGEISRHMGCAEMYTVTEKNATIDSWLMNMDFDFNHLLVDGNKAYFVGDTKYYGATLGVIDLENGAFGQGTAEISYYNLYKAIAEESKGTSGNCMILDGDNYRIASHKGFQSFSADALRNGALEKTYEFISTSGSAKHIAQGEGYIATLNLDEKGNNESTATIAVYNPWGTLKTTIHVYGEQIITPIDGKNVIAIKDDYVYVALGQNGVAKYSIESGKLVKHFNYNKNSKSEKKPLANGLCVDENYVYVANGAAGLIVLDKDTMEKVTSWRRTYIADDGKEKFYSANYVQKVNGLIYIAYGRDGLEVVKLEGDNK